MRDKYKQTITALVGKMPKCEAHLSKPNLPKQECEQNT